MKLAYVPYLDEGVLHNEQLIENIGTEVNIHWLDGKVKGHLGQLLLCRYFNFSLQEEVWQCEGTQREFVFVLLLGVKAQHMFSYHQLETEEPESLGCDGHGRHRVSDTERWERSHIDQCFVQAQMDETLRQQRWEFHDTVHAQ